jgi:hypothetical protein
MPTIHEFKRVSGETHRDCHFLAVRYDERIGNSRDTGEHYVVQIAGNEVHAVIKTRTWLLGLWRSRSGRVFVCDADGGARVSDSGTTGPPRWSTQQLPAVLSGIWGLDDHLAFTWGRGDGPDGHVIFQWDGRAWHPMESPGRVESVCGTAPDLIYAGGDDGLLARWNGQRWSRVPTPGSGRIGGIRVVSGEEMYAIRDGQILMDGSVHGWSDRCDLGQPILALEPFRGELWVSTLNDGLCKLSGTTLVPVRPKFKPLVLDARVGLLAADRERLVFSETGDAFEAISIDTFIQLVAREEPWWKRHLPPEG